MLTSEVYIRNIESLKDFLQESNMNFNIIGLVETWLKDRPHEYFGRL